MRLHLNAFLHLVSCTMLDNLILIILVLHMILLHVQFLVFYHILSFQYNQLQHLSQLHLQHFVYLLQIYLEVVQMLFLVRKHILSCPHPLKMESFYLVFLFFHITHLFQVVQAFYVLKILKNQHLNLEHQFSYVVCFVMHQLLLLHLFYVNI